MKVLKKLFPEFVKKYIRYYKGVLASLFLGNPSKNMKIIAVTGTSGKSTTSAMIFHILKENGFSTGLMSTNGAKCNDISIDTGLHVTTPDPIQLQKVFKKFKEQNAEYVIVETSSHALAQKRVGPINYDYVVYTNIKRDHLDWHKTWEAYATAKASALLKLKDKGLGVVNRDDDSYEFLKVFSKKHGLEDKIISYSERELQNIDISSSEIKFTLSDIEFVVPIIGKYNLFNLLAATTVAQNIGLEEEQIAQALNSFEGLPGRMEILQSEPFMVIVDFAHNADSLEKSLENVQKLTENGKVIVVFGSAGLRDVEKRFTMGEIAGRLADVIIITAEDPRTESLFEINSKIIEGAKQGGAKLVKRIPTHDEYQQYLANTEIAVENKSIFVFDEESIDGRFDAIDFAIRIARDGDVVITEGKGHELSLAFGNTEYPFTDQDAVRKALTLEKEKEDKPEKVIKFTPELTEKIKNKEKTSTMRMFDDKDLTEGESVVLATRDGQNVSEFGEATLTQIIEKPLSKVTKKDYKGFKNLDTSIEEFKQYYGDVVTKSTLVKIITFEVTKLYE